MADWYFMHDLAKDCMGAPLCNICEDRASRARLAVMENNTIIRGGN